MFPEPLTVTRPQARWSAVQFPAELRDFVSSQKYSQQILAHPACLPACLLVSGYCKLHNCGVARD